MISAIGPAIASVLVVLSMLAVIGSPVSWIRLSMIGSAATELSAASIGAEACGVTLGGAGYGLSEMSTAWFTMAINGCGWLLVVFFSPIAWKGSCQNRRWRFRLAFADYNYRLHWLDE